MDLPRWLVHRFVPFPRSCLTDLHCHPANWTLKTPRQRRLSFQPRQSTGAIYSQDEVKQLAVWCARNHIFLIADEVYRRIWFETPPASALSINEAKDAIVVIDSLSKTWSACGLRLGALISRNPNLMEKIERLGQARLGPQPLAQAAGIAALTMDEHYYETVRNVWKTRVDALYNGLNAIEGVTHNRPKGAFYTMVELPVKNSEDFANIFEPISVKMEEASLWHQVVDSHADPSRGQRQIRLAAVLAEHKIAHAIELLGSALSQYNQDRETRKSLNIRCGFQSMEIGPTNNLMD